MGHQLGYGLFLLLGWTVLHHDCNLVNKINASPSVVLGIHLIKINISSVSVSLQHAVYGVRSLLENCLKQINHGV